MSVYRQRDSFMSEWRDEFGVQHRKSFMTLPEAAAYEKQVRRQVAARRVELRRDPLAAVPAVGILCDRWITGRKYWYDRAVAREVKLHFANLRLHQLTVFMADGLLAEWRERILLPKGSKGHLAGNTVGTWRKAFKRLLRYFETFPGAARGLSDIRRGPSYEQRSVTLSVEEERKMLELSQAKPWLHCWLSIFLLTGFRMSEVCRLAPMHYNRASGMLENVLAKGGVHRSLPVHPDLAKILDPLMQRGANPETPFIEIAKGAPLTRWIVCWHFRELKKKAGITRDVRPHDLRRTAISTFHFNQPKPDLVMTQRFSGHKYLSGLQVYLAPFDQGLLLPAMEEARILRFKNPKQRKVVNE